VVLKRGYPSRWKKTEEGYVYDFIRELLVDKSFVLLP
jgi:hypothetical protein